MIKELAKRIGEYRLKTALTPVMAALEVACEVAIPLVVAALVDKGIDAGDMSMIKRYGIYLVALAFLSLVFGVLSGRLAAVSSAGFSRNLRRDIFNQVQEFSFRNIDKFSTAGLITRMTTDVGNVQMAFQMLIRIAVRGPLMLIFSMIMAFSLSKKLSLTFAVIVPVLAVGLFLMIKATFPIFDRVFKTYDRLNNIVQENLRGIRVVKAFVREKHEREKFESTSEEIYRDFSKAERIMALNSPLMQFCVYTAMLAIAYFGAKLITANELTTGELMSLLTYTGQIMMSMMMLSMIFVMLTISGASAKRIVEVLAEKSDLTDGANPLTEMKNADISFENVSFSYTDDENKLCLKNINLHIPQGSMVGIIGATGSGKSSLVQLIPRLYDTTRGRITIGGRDVREYELESLRNQVALVLQKNVLFSGTIAENLRWGDENASGEELQKACRIACAEEFIEKFPEKYETHIEQGGTNVSGGQKQRLCIARALLKKPKILILDDSTSALDTKTDASIRAALRADLQEMTKIIISQRISSIKDADFIAVLDAGEINAVGTHEELLRDNAIYREIYQAQQRGGDFDAQK
ncbi:MAG: ABC transporter [Clostridiales bacterium]|nr:MAG: ABC transporter [Clostridiales bacterium]